MTDRPIIFSAPMVNALLDGRKTQTRRMMPNQEWLQQAYAPIVSGSRIYNYSGEDELSRARFAPGDRLWVRESWHAARSLDKIPPRDIPRDADIEHAATARSYAEIGLKGKLRPGIFLPRWASRLTLLLTDVRVQRLHEISEDDVYAERVIHMDEPGEAIVMFMMAGRLIKLRVGLPQKTTDQLRRSRWRALGLVIKAKLEAVESRISTVEQEFLAHIVLPEGMTVSEWIEPQLMLAYERGQMPTSPLMIAGPRGRSEPNAD
jgi:hypothetical protein